MFWWLELPVKITFFVLTGLVVIVAVVSPSLKWIRAKALGRAIIFAFFGFIPTCYGIMTLVDSRRFGIFRYEQFSDVEDERLRRFLPKTARDITVDAEMGRNRARYTISKVDLNERLDALWEAGGKYARDPRRSPHTESSTAALYLFRDLNWLPPGDLIRFVGPHLPNGAGAVFFFDQETNTVYQHTSYW